MATFIMMCKEMDRVLHKERVFRDRTRQLDTLSDDELYARYRMPRHALLKLLEAVSPSITPATQRSHSLSPETKLLLTLRYLSKGGFFVELGDLHGTVKSSVSRVFHPTVDAICNSINNICFDLDNLRNVKHDFYRLAGFPRVIGAIGGTLVPIRRPPADEEAAYVCRKGFHAINVQAICDANLRFTNVVTKWPGSAHDASILTNSSIGDQFNRNCPDGFLLGDSGYGCRPWLLTPVLDPKTRHEERYNSSHCRTRNTIERAFGVLKSRFRCLHKSTGCLPFSTSKNCKVIMAAFKLHNFCMDQKVPLPQLLEEDQEAHVLYQGNVQDGHQARAQLIAHYFS
ncbi:putative nuclease HARBI1 isoform X1 [Haliotis rufescens]|uniref:putative nuclease HARBI1 isoform X1 n=1 Tax=Haliotis rufescens TaxID=6454 RepID=UPI00201E864B|nr:putative nuclease HARBI1 isoform X1 [Haliotis rufescens]